MRRYFIKRSKDLVEPEEVLIDALRSKMQLIEPMEFSVPERATRLFLGLGIAGLVLLLGYVTYLGVARHEIYIAQADSNRLRPVFIHAPRGIIYDRFGEILAENKEVFDLTVLSLTLPKDERALNELAGRLGALLGENTNDILNQLTRIKDLGYAEPSLLRSNISRDHALAIEKDKQNLPGIRLTGRYVRFYSGGYAFSHLIGHTGLITRAELEGLPNVFANDVIGRSGVEAFYDARLRGERGREDIEINAALQIVDLRYAFKPLAGENLRLTIDAGLQRNLFEIMSRWMAERDRERATAVAINPQTGEVLAMVSFPSFDNNSFAQGISRAEHLALTQNPSRPIFNRALHGTYSPGSTFKPMIAAAALEEKIIEPEVLIDASRGYISIPNPYHPDRPAIFRDWQVHGWVDMKRAIAFSSNIYFYVVGGGYGNRSGLGITRIQEYLERFGFGIPTGIDLSGEARGVVPGPELKRVKHPNDPAWRTGDTYITTIGQGDVLVTPLQLAVAYAAFANGGYIVSPHVLLDPTEDMRANRRSLGIAPENMAVVQEAMHAVTTIGTARSLRVLPMETAGKTGTAEVAGNQPHSLFVAYAPRQNPTIALAVIVENDRVTPSTATPIARETFQWYWENRAQR